jgi:hypothetical protein
MAALTTQVVNPSGTVITYAAAAAGGDTFKGNPRGIFRVKNADATATTVTIVVPGNTNYGQALPDIALSVAAGAEANFAFDQSFLDGTGSVAVTYSKVTSLTVAYTES